jgi:hypothetical protein
MDAVASHSTETNINAFRLASLSELTGHERVIVVDTREREPLVFGSLNPLGQGYCTALGPFQVCQL